jgi:hypothetical protein
MSPLPTLRQLPVATLVVLLLLTASSARADMATEVLYVTRAEISEEALRGVIGIAFIHTDLGADGRPSGEVPRYRPSGDGFEPAGTLAVKELGALSGWDYETALRKFPVVEQRWPYLHVVIDVRTNERAWLRAFGASHDALSVTYQALDSQELQWGGIAYLELAPDAQTRLYMAPREDARSHPLSLDQPARLNGEVVELRIIRTKGNFIQVGAMVDWDSPLVPLGWLRITDENGLLRIWPMMASMC